MCACGSDVVRALSEIEAAPPEVPAERLELTEIGTHRDWSRPENLEGLYTSTSGVCLESFASATNNPNMAVREGVRQTARTVY